MRSFAVNLSLFSKLFLVKRSKSSCFCWLLYKAWILISSLWASSETISWLNFINCSNRCLCNSNNDSDSFFSKSILSWVAFLAAATSLAKRVFLSASDSLSTTAPILSIGVVSLVVLSPACIFAFASLIMAACRFKFLISCSFCKFKSFGDGPETRKAHGFISFISFSFLLSSSL